MNNRLLVEKVKLSHPPRNIAELLGMSTATWYNKISGNTQWNACEIVKLAQVLGWTSETLLNILEFKED